MILKNNVTIGTVLASSDEFERLVAEIMINDEVIGHIEKEKPDEPCKTVFYDDITIFRLPSFKKPLHMLSRHYWHFLARPKKFIKCGK